MPSFLFLDQTIPDNIYKRMTMYETCKCLNLMIASVNKIVAVAQIYENQEQRRSTKRVMPSWRSCLPWCSTIAPRIFFAKSPHHHCGRIVAANDESPCKIKLRDMHDTHKGLQYTGCFFLLSDPLENLTLRTFLMGFTM